MCLSQGQLEPHRLLGDILHQEAVEQMKFLEMLNGKDKAGGNELNLSLLWRAFLIICIIPFLPCKRQHEVGRGDV